MNRRLHVAIQGELTRLVAMGLLSADQMAKIEPRYPVEAWNVVSLIRWFTILGAVSLGLGVIILVPRLIDVQNAIDGGLALAAVGCIYGSVVLERRQLAKSAAAVQLLASFALQGLITALAIRFSTGSDDWPRLIAVCSAAAAILAYALGSRLVLIHALVLAFTAFGGETGYVSGWGMYWMKMDYPTRFIAAGLLALLLGAIHARWVPGVRQGFARVYAHFGLLVINLALWFFSLFGFYDGPAWHWAERSGERLGFSALWALVALASIFGGARFGLRMARGYGMTFFLINIYTFYFQFIVSESAELWFVHLLVVGGSMVGVGVGLERWASHRREGAAVAT